MSNRKSITAFSRDTVADLTRHYRQLLKPWRLLCGGVLGALLLTTLTQSSSLAEKVEIPVAEDTASSPIENGIYFYGSASELEVIGAAYMVFAAQNSQLVGAIFMPQSSFDCFRGHLEAQQLALQITNSYTQEVYDYEIARASDESTIASAGDSGVSLQLDGFHNLGSPTDAVLTLLSTCQNALPLPEVEL